MAMTVPDIQIAGGGGLTNWRQSVEMIMYGATALTYCTALYFLGFEVLEEIEAGLRRYVVEQGYSNILDVRGMALQHITVPHEVVYVDKLPLIERETCVGCGFCIRPGHCEALALVDGKAKLVEPGLCTRCGVCYWLCPHDAISMVPAEAL
jgi:dihydropyrimidine dehydrogenase (NAD+) subunit PreA